MKTLTIALALASCLVVSFAASAQLKTPDHVGDLKDPVEMRTDFVRADVHSVLLTPSFEVTLPARGQHASYRGSLSGI